MHAGVLANFIFRTKAIFFSFGGFKDEVQRLNN